MPLKINLKSVIFYLSYAICAVLLNAAVKGVPLSLGLCFSMLLCGANAILTPAVYCLASAVHMNLAMGLFSLFEGGFLAAITFIYRRTDRKIKFEAVIYLAIALAPYIAFCPWLSGGNAILNNPYALKGIAAAGTLVFTFFCFRSVHSAIFRLLRCRPREDEIVCFAVLYAACGAGLYNLAGNFVYTAVACALIIFCTRLARSPASLACALVFALPPAVIQYSPDPMTAFLIIACGALLFCNAGRFAPSVVGGGLCGAYCYFSGFFTGPTALIVFRAVFVPACCLLPAVKGGAFYAKLKDMLLCKGALTSSAIERAKRQTGEKLYRISEVFREIECAFYALDEKFDDAAARERMCKDLREKCCKNCDRAAKCEKTAVYSGFKKLIDAGCVKGRVNLIDLPGELTGFCSNPTEILSKSNAILSEYRRFMTEAENARSGRKLLAEQARGVADVMKGCAVELCRSEEDFPAAEKSALAALSAHGVSCPELKILSGGNEIYAVILGKANARAVAEILSATLKKKYIIKDKTACEGDKQCFVFGAPPPLDAAFGVAHAVKDGEKISGDTHSVIRINDRAFLMALSDGMGSGEYAKKVSATAISLIEAFYRAEMPADTILNTINKLLSFNRDERFTCIDIAAVNLETGRADFVKIGSPAGVIVREGEIKILESESLPLGILENLHPTVCTEKLKDGDIVVFMSDGVTSAFPSAPEMYEFLQGIKPLNPQSLADKILAGALSRTGGAAGDDMTVLCTRIFDNT